MKRNSIFFAALAAFALCACNTVEEIQEEEFHAGRMGDGVFFEIPVPAEDDCEAALDDDEEYETKTYYSSQTGHFVWSESDTIGVVSTSKKAQSGQVSFWVDSKAGDVSVNFTGGDFGLKGNTTYCAYYPYVLSSFDKTKIPFSVVGQVQNANGSRVHDKFDCLYSIATARNSSGSVAADFNFIRLSSFFRFKIKPEAGTYTELILSAAEAIIPVESTYNVTANPISLSTKTMASSLSLKLNDIVIGAGEELVAYLTFIPANWSGKKLTVSLFDSEGKCYSYSTTPSKSYTADKIYTMDIGTKMTVDPSNYLLGNSAYGMYDLSKSEPVITYESGKDMYSCSKKGSAYNFRILNPGGGSDYKFISLKFSDNSCTIYEPENSSLNGKAYNVTLLKQDEKGNRWYKSSDGAYGFIVNFCE